MSFVNYNAKEIHCKVVYYGPSLGGKTTNVQWIFQKTTNDPKSKLMTLNVENERTIFFDFLPLSLGEIRGFQTRFHLYSVPGQMVYDASRKLVLKGLDGVVFVADSQIDRMEENLQSLENLKTNLEQQGSNIHQIPLAFQYNKRDLPNIMLVNELRSKLNPYNAPDFEAIAPQGVGVFETFKALSKKIITILKGGES